MNTSQRFSMNLIRKTRAQAARRRMRNVAKPPRKSPFAPQKFIGPNDIVVDTNIGRIKIEPQPPDIKSEPKSDELSNDPIALEPTSHSEGIEKQEVDLDSVMPELVPEETIGHLKNDILILRNRIMELEEINNRLLAKLEEAEQKSTCPNVQCQQTQTEPEPKIIPSDTKVLFSQETSILNRLTALENVTRELAAAQEKSERPNHHNRHEQTEPNNPISFSSFIEKPLLQFTAQHNPNRYSTSSHPLLHPTVLKVLFGFLEEKDLRSCRLVHTRWNIRASSHLKKRGGFVSICSKPKMEGTVSTFYRFWSFLSCVKSSRNFPFKKICISLEVALDNREAVMLNNILWYISAWVKELKITVPSGIFPKIPTGIVFHQLHKLRYENYCYYPDWIDLPKIVQYSPNLKTLDLFMVRYPTFRILSRIRNLKLETLVLERLPGMAFVTDGAQDDFLNFLKSQRDSLQVVVLHVSLRDKYKQRIFSLLPQLPCLKFVGLD